MYPKVWEKALCKNIRTSYENSRFWKTALGKSIDSYWSSRKPEDSSEQTLTEALEADGWKTVYDSEGNICWYENEDLECKPVDTEIEEASEILARAIYNVERK